MKARIAVFRGYASPFAGRRSLGRPFSGRPLGYPGLGRGLPSLGRRGYYVPPERGYGPLPEGARAYPIVRRGYKVKRMKDTPAMKRAQSRMKKAAKTCSRRRKGSFQACMKKMLRKKR